MSAVIVDPRLITPLAVCLTLSAWPVSLWAQSVPVSDATRTALDTRAVVVLPFANISTDASDEWVGAGIAATVAADLSQMGMSSDVADGVLAARGRTTARHRLGGHGRLSVGR